MRFLKTLGLLFVLCSFAGSALGAFERMPSSGRSAAMGGASIGNVGDIWSNPSLVAGTTNCVLFVNYVPELFGLKELSRASCAFIVPTSLGAFAVSGSRFGFDLYREVMLTTTYAICHGDLVIGINVNWYSLIIRNYGSASSIGSDVGLSIRIAEDLRWGLAAQNVNVPTIGREKEKLPQVLLTGIAYSPTDESTIALDLSKDVRYPVEIHMGAEYSLFHLLDLRVGTSSEPAVYNAGAGIRYAGIGLDYAFSTHPDLGATHQFSFFITFGGK